MLPEQDSPILLFSASAWLFASIKYLLPDSFTTNPVVSGLDVNNAIIETNMTVASRIPLKSNFLGLAILVEQLIFGPAIII